jgi:hypothetical protein
MAKNYHTPNMGSSPLDGIANASAAIQALWKKIKGKKPLSPTEFAKAKANAMITSAAESAGITLGMCKHRGTKRGSKCGGCGSKIW